MDLNLLTVEDCVVNRFYHKYREVPRKYLFIDFDGTIRKAVDNSNPKPGYAETYHNRPPLDPEEVELFPGIVKKLIEWTVADYMIVGITNQSGVQEGGMTYRKCVETCMETTRQIGLFFPVVFAPCKSGNPDIVNLRKPNTGMIDLTEKLYGPIDRDFSLLVGDYKTDIQTGMKASIKTLKVDSSKEGSDFPLPPVL